MKKFLAMMIAVIMLVSLSTAAFADSKKQLKLWMPPMTSGDTLDLQFWKEHLEPWAEENNVDLSITIIPWDNYEERYLTAFIAGEAPDVGYMYNEMLYEYIDNELIEPLDDYLTDEDRDYYYFLDSGVHVGKQYTMPLSVGGASCMFFNMDILNQAGVEEVPETWQEFIDVALKIKEANIPGVVPYAADWGSSAIGILNSAYYPFMWQAGGELFNGNEVALLDNGGAVEAAQFIYDLRYKYEVMPEDVLSIQDINSMFINGEVAMMAEPSNYSSIWDENGINWDFVPGLKHDENSESVTWVAADALIMNAASEEKELAWSLIHYITSASVMEDYHLELDNEPPLGKGERYLANERFKTMYEESAMRALPVAENSVGLMQTLKSNLQLMLLGDLTPEEAIQNTVEYAESMN